MLRWTLLLAAACAASAFELDFRNAVIVLPPNAGAREKTAATMVAEEIVRRTQIRLPIATSAGGRAAIEIRRAGETAARP